MVDDVNGELKVHLYHKVGYLCFSRTIDDFFCNFGQLQKLTDINVVSFSVLISY